MTKLQSTTWSVPDARNKDRSKTPKKVLTNSSFQVHSDMPWGAQLHLLGRM